MLSINTEKVERSIKSQPIESMEMGSSIIGAFLFLSN